MKEIRNLNGKRICDMTDDGKAIVIVQKDCITKITANPDGTLVATQDKLKPAV